MPRVSEAHLAARRQQILEAAQRCFSEQGFHGTTMVHVIDEAGLSVGAVYRYFKSKNELIIAIAESVINEASAMFEQLATEEPPLSPTEAVDRAILFVDRQTGPDGLMRIALQVWAEAMHDPALAEFVANAYGRMRGHFVLLATRARDAGQLPPDTDVEAVGAVLFGMVPGYALQRILAGGPGRGAYLDGVRALIR
ncbi:TetR family transcriptional regulator [Asanoa ishikariensis]|uniref:Transcriptional regulator, TetR family n=1 Tax=Asanoa ishikariensis TaxID=137265 RepID=A0A1H3QRG4_9ACTN|nr:TetR/AcrR family transcriptional regulator [Asanoa ishikariensis]GIF64769.1 TetR family transcriptional regulator [Asanoa ishikariensis]SDZ15920.1 transcriptional regulator, TetR family [Asanoa ishikariensis]